MTIARPDFVDRPARRRALALLPLACDTHAPSVAQRSALLVENPQRLYRFAE